MANALRAINTRAKQIRKAHPAMKYSTAIKKASAEYRAKGKKKSSPKRKVSGVKKKPAAKKIGRASSKPRKVGTIASGKVSIGSVRQTARAQKKALEERLGREMVRHYNAKTKTEKRKVGKTIRETKRKITIVKKML